MFENKEIETVEYVDNTYELPRNSQNLHNHIVDQFTMEQKKKIREARYRNSTEELNEELFYNLLQSNTNILTLVIGSNKNKEYRNTYQGDLVWDPDKLEKLEKDLKKENIAEEKDIDNLITFINPPEDENTSIGERYERAEQLLGNNPNVAIAAMTILEKNYFYAIASYIPRFVFTEKEEAIFYTGRTILVALNKKYESRYVNDLIKRVDDIIAKFNQGFVIKNAFNYKNALADEEEISITFEDLLQQGNEGLTEALSDFDIDRGVKFSTHARLKIRKKIRRHIIYNILKIKPSVSLWNTTNNFKKAEEELAQITGREPHFDKAYLYCKENNIKIPEKGELLEALRQRKVLSLDREIKWLNGDARLLDLIEDKSADISRGLVEKDWGKLKEGLLNGEFLSQRERRIILSRYMITPNKDESYTCKDKYTLAEIGEREGVSIERARQIEKIALMKLSFAATKLGISKQDILNLLS